MNVYNAQMNAIRVNYNKIIVPNVNFMIPILKNV